MSTVSKVTSRLLALRGHEFAASQLRQRREPVHLLASPPAHPQLGLILHTLRPLSRPVFHSAARTSPTTSPRLFRSSVEANSGTSKPRVPRKRASAARRGRAVPSADLTAKAVPSGRRPQISPSA